MEQQINRRSFLKLLGLAAPVAAVAPTYFFSPIGGWKSDVIINPNEILQIDAPSDNEAMYGVIVQWAGVAYRIESSAANFCYNARQVGKTEMQRAIWPYQKTNYANVKL